MEGFVFSKKVSKTRNPHVCEVCAEIIPEGSEVMYCQRKDEHGRFSRDWTHLECWEKEECDE